MSTNSNADELVLNTIVQAARAAHVGADDHFGALVQDLAGPELPAGLVDRKIEELLRIALSTLVDKGWQPRDLAEIGARRLDSAGQSLLLDHIASVAARFAAATVDPRWLAQLDELEAEVWWAPERRHLPQWGERIGFPRAAALGAAVTVIGVLHTLPPLERLLAPPGSFRPSNRPAASAPQFEVDEKVLGRIRALLAKAESTEFAEEAEALSAKAQELMTRFSLDRALLEATAPQEAPTRASAVRMWLAAPYVRAKSTLISAVARSNLCRAVFHEDFGFVTVIGDETDIRLVEILATSLLVQADRAMLARGSRIGDAGKSRTRSYRQSFLAAYAARIRERLETATSTSQADVEATAGSAAAERLHPVLAARRERTEQLLTELFPSTRAYGIKVSNAAGWADGREAADRASLDARSALPA